MPDVWDITTGDPSVVIATIDTGANPIPDLADALVPGWDFVDNDPEAQDLNGHGTQVASVIAARGNNGVGMAGYCWQCKVMPIRVSGNPNMIAAGIMYAVEHGARVIDISLTRPGLAALGGGVRGSICPRPRGRGDRVGREQRQRGDAVSGRVPRGARRGATDDTDGLYFWSSRGPWVALTAPGCNLVLNPFAGTLCGTSFTPAVVAGIAACCCRGTPA